MLNRLKTVWCCRSGRENHNDDVKKTGFLSIDMGNHISMVSFEKNTPSQDRYHVEIGNEATFVGVYDGHLGHSTCDFVLQRLFYHISEFSEEMGSTMSVDILRRAFSATENEFTDIVRGNFKRGNHVMATVGSCALVGVIWRKELYVANLGDSRAVMGSLNRYNRIAPVQLTTDHNVNELEIREELVGIHNDDPIIVSQRDGRWTIKGLTEVTRSFGHAYLKSAEFSVDNIFPRRRVGKTIVQPILRDDPEVMTRNLEEADKFIVFASDGLWKILSNQAVVDIVHNNSRKGSAKELVLRALEKRASERDMDKARFHDDITVVVVFLKNLGRAARYSECSDGTERALLKFGPSEKSPTEIAGTSNLKRRSR